MSMCAGMFSRRLRSAPRRACALAAGLLLTVAGLGPASAQTAPLQTASAQTASAQTAQVQTAVPVQLALVLLTDVSTSVDGHEYGMVKRGYRAAFSDPEVIAAIEASGGVAIAYVEFSDQSAFHLVHGWEVIADAESSRRFGHAVGLAPRTSSGTTALAASLREATRMLTEGGFGPARLVIDVASDLSWDGGRVASQRDATVAAGVTINGLPIIDGVPFGTIDGRMAYPTYQTLGGISGFFERDIIGGNGAFMVEARDYAAFGEALRRKLLRELMVSSHDTAQVRMVVE